MKSALIFAYACDPTRGSEPGAGFAIAQQATAILDEVVVITRREEAGAGAFHTDEALGPTATVHTVWSPKSGPIYMRYTCWVIGAAWTARRLRKRRDFAVLHHATYANDWFINPLHLLKKVRNERWVWGPAGGASYPPPGLAATVTGDAAGSDRMRSALTGSMRSLFQRLLRSRIDYALALNADSARAFKQAGFASVEVSSNFVVEYDELPDRAEDINPPKLLWASRGEKWKGILIATKAFAELPAQWTFTIMGPETDTPEINHEVKDNADRVTFAGAVPRETVLSEIATSSVLILPSLHDSAPWIAGEAAGIGTPVVCLDLGGVAAMAGTCAVSVSPTPVETLVERLAQAIETAGRSAPTPFHHHTASELQLKLSLAYGLSPR